jgi:hypothetical protein
MNELVVIYSTQAAYQADVEAGVSLANTICLIEENGTLLVNNHKYGASLTVDDLRKFGLDKFGTSPDGKPTFNGEEILTKSSMTWVIGN